MRRDVVALKKSTRFDHKGNNLVELHVSTKIKTSVLGCVWKEGEKFRKSGRSPG